MCELTFLRLLITTTFHGFFYYRGDHRGLLVRPLIFAPLTFLRLLTTTSDGVYLFIGVSIGATSETGPQISRTGPTASDRSGLYNPLSSFQVLAAAKLVT